MGMSATPSQNLALLLPAHNEALIIRASIRSAVAAGQKLEDIYVVDDASTDGTRREALKELPESNFLTVERSGKAGAIHKAIAHFDIETNYVWLHIADADSIFGRNYFHIYRQALSRGNYAAAVGFVQSLRGNWIARYRAFSYTYGQHIFRRLQSWLGMITVLPGPVTCLRTDIIRELDFITGSLTEDFDITLQIHRKRLGKIKFIPEAINYTQDPRTIRDFSKQTLRWHRGFFQGVRKYRIGTRLQAIDISIAYQMFEVVAYLLQLFVLFPYLLFVQHNPIAVAVIFLSDYTILCILAFISAGAVGRPSIVLAIPYCYLLRMLELSIFVWAFWEVIVLSRFQSAEAIGWETGNRRYKLTEKALQDVAQ